jgi:CubicO group peptidase (beta-lactamase class C family)
VTLDEVLDGAAMARRLELEEPLWVPGTGHSYHALTHGWLIGEVIHRVTGRTVGEHVRGVLAGPLGADAWIGLPAELEGRVAHLRAGAGLLRSLDAWRRGREAGVVDWGERALTLGGAFPPELVSVDGGFNDPKVHRAEIPAAGGIASARALAAIWSAAIVPTDGLPRILDDRTIEVATRARSEGPQVFAPLPPWVRWGMGFQLDSDARRFVTPSGFGHDGAGGQLTFADPGVGIGFAFLTNVLQGDADERANRIVDAVRDSTR